MTDESRIVELTVDGDLYRVRFYGERHTVRKIRQSEIGEIELIPTPADRDRVFQLIPD